MVDASARRLFSLFERHGSSDYIGEPMSITEHSVQTANAALKAGETDMAVLACLLHDVGHLCGLEAGHAPGMGGCGTPDHERIGADFLGALGLPQDIAYLCHHHVGAKRYLCATVPGYEERLSEASSVTLQHQGGPMSPAEVAAADADPRWPLVLRMRRYDEAGKDPHVAATSPRDFEAPLRAALRASVVQQLDAAAASPLAYPLSPFASGCVETCVCPLCEMRGSQHVMWPRPASATTPPPTRKKHARLSRDRRFCWLGERGSTVGRWVPGQ